MYQMLEPIPASFGKCCKFAYPQMHVYDSGKKLEYPKGTHADHMKSPWPHSNPDDLVVAGQH